MARWFVPTVPLAAASVTLIVLVGGGNTADAAPRSGDVRPAQISMVASRSPLPGERPWENARRCSVVALAQAWAGENAVNCGGYPFGEPGERGTACLLAAQQAHLPAYAVTSRGASLLDGEGHARELILSPETMTVLRGVPQRLPASFSYGARACARFAPARDRFSPPECVEPRALAGAQLREWACLGPAAASAVPPERASRGAVGDPVPLGGEARRGGPITDPRVPPALLETGRWSITTVEVARTEVGTAAHVHAAGSLLLLVNAGALEVEVQGSPPTTVYPGEWVYLPAGVPHRMAVLERTSVTLHLREGAACPELLPGHREPAISDAMPDWALVTKTVVPGDCDPAAVGRAWAGNGAIDCGLVDAKGDGPRCAMWAQEHGRAFFVHEYQRGIDSVPSHVLVRTGSGDLYELQFDQGFLRDRREGEHPSLGIHWRACGHLVGPSWRARFSPTRTLGSALSCVPLLDDGRVAGALPAWRCLDEPPPGIPEPAREAIAVVRANPDRSPPPALASLGTGPLSVRTFAWNGADCVAPVKVASEEVWYFSAPFPDRGTHPYFITVRSGANRQSALGLGTLPPNASALLYWRRGTPSPAFPRCEVKMVRPGQGSFLGIEQRPSRPKQIDVAPPAPGQPQPKDPGPGGM